MRLHGAGYKGKFAVKGMLIMDKLKIIAYILLGVCLAFSAYTDLKTRLISTWLCLVFGAGGLVLTVINAVASASWHPVADALLGLLPSVVLYGTGRLARGAIGTGDVLLFAVSGLYLGLVWNLIFIWTACFFTLLTGGVLLALKKIERKGSLPLAPFALAAWAVLGAGGLIL